uniref:Uncharacterized protein n=1 Tax=Oryza brachyantha TaxID=4533 RepID=J3LHX9_ORYBR
MAAAFPTLLPLHRLCRRCRSLFLLLPPTASCSSTCPPSPGTISLLHVSNCPLGVGKKVVKLCGFSIPGQRFYNLHIDKLPDNKNKGVAIRILSIKKGTADGNRVTKELTDLFPGLKWDWKVKQLNEKDFLVSFPSEENRNFFTRFPSFDFRCLTIKASVVASNMTEEAIDELISIWVKMKGVPEIAKTETYIRAITEMMGEFEELDDSSLMGDGPVRVKCACMDPRALFFKVHIYINKVGYDIFWEPEGYQPKGKDEDPPRDDGDDDHEKGDGGR